MRERDLVRSIFHFEGDINVFRQKSEEVSRFRTRLVRLQGAIAGVLIGTGVGGWVALGMDPKQALALFFFGASFGFGGYSTELKRQFYKRQDDTMIEIFGDEAPPKDGKITP